MSDSQNPVELDSLKSPRRGSKSSTMKGTIIASLLGMASAVGVFLVIRGNMEDDRKDTSPSEITQSDTSPQSSAAELANDETPVPSSDEPNLSAVEPEEKLIAQTDANDAKSDDTEPQDSDAGDAPDTESSTSVADAETSVSAEPPKLPDRAKKFRLGEEVDLIEMFEPALHTAKGSWEKVGEKIVSELPNPSVLVLPYELPQNYVMQIRLKIAEGKDSIFIRTRLQDHLTDLVLNGWYGTVGGFQNLDGLWFDNNNNEVRFTKPMVRNDKPSDLLIISNKNSIFVTLDGTTIIDWTGDPSRLSTEEPDPSNAFGRMRIKTLKTRYEISHFSVTPINHEPLLAIPDDATIKQTEKDLENRLEISFRITRKADKLDFARKLQALVVTETDPTARYVLLSHALKNASEAGELDLSFRISEHLAREFDVSVSGLKQQTIEQIAKINRDPVSSYQLSLISSDLAWESADQHRYEEANTYLKIAVGLAKQSRIKVLSLQLDETADLFESWQKSYEPVRSSHSAVEQGTANEEDNLAWGKYLCLVRQDWETGLPLLKLGGDSELAQLAREELDRPGQFDPIIQLVGKWLTLASTFEGKEKLAIENHARRFSLSAMPWAEESQRPLIHQYSRDLFNVKTIWDTSPHEKGMLIGGETANPTLEATIEFWIRTMDRLGGAIMKRETEPIGTIGVNIRDGKPILYVSGSYYWQDSRSEVFISDGRWHHIAVSKIGNELCLFVDGIRTDAKLTSRDGFPKANSSAWRIGDFKWELGRHLEAEFARIRISSVSRYHTRFVPSRTYEADRATMLLQ